MFGSYFRSMSSGSVKSTCFATFSFVESLLGCCCATGFVLSGAGSLFFSGLGAVGRSGGVFFALAVFSGFLLAGLLAFFFLDSDGKRSIRPNMIDKKPEIADFVRSILSF